jgi:outer membrane protein OmpA-like peptidoglycan-associated protein
MRGFIVGVGVAVLTGCATANPPQELVDARAAYGQAQQGPAQKYKPDQLHEARTELDQAEADFKEDPNAEKTKTSAYLAERKAQLAGAEGRTAEALDEKSQLTSDANRAQAAGLTKVQGELSTTRQALASQTQALNSQTKALQSETEARMRAEASTKDALDKLALASVPVKQEPRGLVITLPGAVLFASGQYTLLASAQDKLNQVANVLKDQSDHKITVEGYTDSRGSDAMNQELSRNRADSVRQYLVDRGVSGDHIDASGLGSTHPLADNSSPEGRANNRRVEIVVTPIEPK